MSEPLEIIVERDGVQRRVEVDGESVTLGRGKESDVRLDDPLASREHCRLERLGAEVFVVDLDSANGTWVNGGRVQRRPLAAGEEFRIGSTRVRLGGSLAENLASIESTQTQQVSRERDMLQTLLAVLRAVHGEDRLDRMAAMLIDAAVSLTRAERGFLFLVEKGRTTLAMGRNFAREPVAAPEQKISRTLLGRALESDEPLLLRDASSDGQFAGVQSISDLGLRALLAAPLRWGDEVLGLLVVDHRLAPGAFQHDDAGLTAAIGIVAASALGAARERLALAGVQRKLASLQRQLGQRSAAPAKDEVPRTGLATGSGRFRGIVGSSPVMERLYAAMEKVVDSEVPVLIQGHSGTGKELVAQAIHFGGPRADRPFVTENCGALPDTLLESELFGHVKGAFTGATRDRVGRFEEADGGTLFLDEVGEMTETMQARLLRALQEGEIRRLGSDQVVKVDVRVLAATNKDLAEAVRTGRFREDLYYRLKVVQLDLPPLRARQGEVPLLCEHFMVQEAAELGRERREITATAMAALEAYAWPGNVRQLRNEVRRLLLLGEGPVGRDELSPEILGAGTRASGDPGPDHSLPDRIGAIELAAIREAMDEHKGNRSQAARQLGISRFALLRKLEKYGALDDLAGDGDGGG